MVQRDPPVIATYARRLNVFLGNDFPIGSKCIPWYYVINFQKGGTLPFCLFLMFYFDNWSFPCWCYTAAHGSYGLAWLMKHRLFPDPAWAISITPGGAIMSFVLVLGLYWVAPFLLAARLVDFEPSPGRCALGMGIYALGLGLMMGADCYKTATLAAKPGLITTGPFELCRHPNYLGEMMIYGGFAVMVPHILPKLVLVWVWVQLFATNILMKEARMSRHAGWDEYCQKTPMLLPSPLFWFSAPDASKRA